MLKGTALNCEGCGEKEAEVECADCAPKGADSDPLPLCSECCARVHIGHGRLSRHRVTDLAFRRQQIELKAKFDRCLRSVAEVKDRKIQLNYCREDINERVKMYERQIRENTLSVIKKAKSRAMTLIKKMKDAADKRTTELKSFDKYLSNNLYRSVNQIEKDIHNLETEPKDEIAARIKAIEEKIEAVDFNLLRDHLPSSCLEYQIDFDGVEEDIRLLDFELVNKKPATFIEPPETNTFYKDTLEEGCEIKVCVQTVVNKTGDFWCQPHYPPDVFDKLLDISHKIRQEYMCNLSWKPFEPQDEELKVGTLCCVLYPNDNKWYRGCIEDLRSDRKSATVRYLDFGNTAIHTVNQILPFKCFVAGVPFQALECRLSGVSEDLSHDAKWMFNDMVRDKLVDGKFIKKEKLDNSHSFWLVELKLSQEDNNTIDVNQLVKERAESKVQKEAITCRDIRLSDENLPSSFKVVSSTVKHSDETIVEEKSGLTSGSDNGAQSDPQGSEKDKIDTQEERKSKEPSTSEPPSQDIRNVVYKSQDIRNILPKSKDARQTTSSTQDIRKTSGSQDDQKTSSQDNRNSDNQSKDNRNNDTQSDQSSQEPVDEGLSFLSSIGLQDGDEDNRGGEGIPVDSTEQLLGEFFQIQQQIFNQELVAESCQLESSLPARVYTVAQVESMSGVASLPVNSQEERQSTWIPSGNSYSGVVRPPVGKPPASFLSQKSTKLKSRSLEQEAQAVVANIIQDVVSHFCVNGTSVDVGDESEDHGHDSHNSNFLQDLACDLQSRGSDEPTSESSTVTPSDEALDHHDSLDGKEQTSVKSLLTETEEIPIKVKVKSYPKLTKSVSNSLEDINVKDSILKPEIQDKSLGYLCGRDKEETELKRVVEIAECSELQFLSLSTNNISQLESIGLELDECGGQGDSFRPDEDVEHVQTCDPSEIDDISLFARLPRIIFIPGSKFEVYVLDDMQEDGSFNVQIARTEAEEAVFNQFTTKLRLQALKSPACSVVNKGDIILAPFDDSWYRAEVEQVNHDQTVTVTFVDYGNTETTYAPDIRPVPDELLYVPNQSSRCSLASFSRPTFTDPERVVFNQLVDGVKLTATVVAQGYSVLQVTLTSTADEEAKDILKLVDNEVRKVTSDTSHSHQGQGDIGSQRAMILHGADTFVPYCNVPFLQTPISPMNYLYYPPPRGTMNFSQGQIIARRATTIETYPCAPNNGVPNQGEAAAFTDRPVRDGSPKPPDYTFCGSPSQLREDAERFNPASVYISPLKSDQSLDQHIAQKTTPLSPHTERRSVIGREEPRVEVGPLSLTSEPSSSFFDEDAWNECDSIKWTSCESLSEKPKMTGRPSLSRHHQPPSGSSQPPSHRNQHRNRFVKDRSSRQQRNDREFGNGTRPGLDAGEGTRPGRDPRDGHRSGRDTTDGARSGNSSDSSERGDRKRTVCYYCNKPGHYKNHCPQRKQFENDRPKGIRSSKQWRN